MAKQEGLPVAAETLWTSVLKPDSHSELTDLLANLSKEELQGIVKKVAEESREKIAELIRPYQTKVTWRTLNRKFG